ncbi:MAG TPA: nitroreductase family protein, partial [bacterium]|nr:nitroreductase family protein [bacterium]
WRPILKWFVKSLRDPEVARIGKRLREEKRDIVFYDAPCVVFFLAKAYESYGEADCLLAAQNLMVAAQAMGIGSVMLGTVLMANRLSQARAFLRIPSDYQIRCVVALGYSDEPVRDLPERKDNMLGWVE